MSVATSGRRRAHWRAATVLCVGMALGAHAMADVDAGVRVRGVVNPEQASVDVSTAVMPGATGVVPEVILAAPERWVSPMALERDPDVVAPAQVAIGRPLPEASAGGLGTHWTALPTGGEVSAARFVSRGAEANRAVLQVRGIHPAARLRFFGGEEGAPAPGIEVTGSAVIDALALGGDGVGLYVGPVVEGEAITVELWLPEGVARDVVDVSVVRLSHFVVTPGSDPRVNPASASGACNVDVACRPEWSDVARGVARMVFSDPFTGDSYQCSGSLLNDTVDSRTPYFLTARHCIDSQAYAQTLQTYWFYEHGGCGVGFGQPTPVVRGGGAALLFSDPDTDTSLLRLNEPAPAGTVFLGWSAARLSLGTRIGAVHHPRGDVKKVSLGRVQDYADCFPDSLACRFASVGQGTHVVVGWTSGVVEPGSSGSGLFITDGDERYLVGQLHGGNSSCAAPGGYDLYGRFDRAYAVGLSNWLNPVGGYPLSAAPVFRFYNTVTNTHFFTTDPAERDHIIAAMPSFRFEGVAFLVSHDQRPGTTPVYRFYNTAGGVHFYTQDVSEAEHILNTMPHFRFEGIAWHAKNHADGSNIPVFRFLNTGTGAHFYTTSVAERDALIAAAGVFVFEGVAYHAWAPR